MHSVSFCYTEFGYICRILNKEVVLISLLTVVYIYLYLTKSSEAFLVLN